jgi:hypothetical protein
MWGSNEFLRQFTKRVKGRLDKLCNSFEAKCYEVFFRHKNKHSNNSIVSSHGPIVSLTTYGTRTRKAYLAIESIARGHFLPSRLILWIDEAHVVEQLPIELKRLQKRGLEIKLCLNYGPHKKYYPYIAGELSFSKPLVIADDDTIYPRDWLLRLKESYRQDSNTVLCYRARRIIVTEAGLAPYSTWHLVQDTIPSYLNMATGCAGVMYPEQFLLILKEQGTEFLQCCPLGDDLWLHVQAIRAGYRIRQVAETFHLLEVPNTQLNALHFSNTLVGNDQQIQKTYTFDDLKILLGEAANSP